MRRLADRTTEWWPVALCTLALLVAAACQPDNQGPCDGCPSGESCNKETNRCEPTGLPRFDGPAPARSLAVATRPAIQWMAAIAPDQSRLVAGPIGVDGPDLRSVANVPTSSPTSLSAISTRTRSNRRPSEDDTVDDVFAIAWNSAEQQFRFALHSQERWRRSDPIGAADEDYTASTDFDLAVDEGGRFLLAFRDRDADGLYLLREPAARGADDPSPGRITSPGSWRLELIDDGNETIQSCVIEDGESNNRGIGTNPSLLIDQGRIHVVYFDPACGDLRYATRSLNIDSGAADAWTVELADTGDRETADSERPGVGRYSDVAVTAGGNLAIAYSDQTRGRLMFAVRRSQIFETTTVDRGSRLGSFSQKRKHLVGAYVDLAVTDDGTPLIAYMDATDNRVRVARRPSGNGGWIHQSVDLQRPNGYYSVLAGDGEDWRIYTERKRPTTDGLASRLIYTTLSEIR